MNSQVETMGRAPRKFSKERARGRAKSGTNRVIEAEEINPEDLVELVKGRRLAIRIPGFYSVEGSSRFVRKILDSELMQSYEAAPWINKVGKALFDAAGNPSALRDYYDEAPVALRTIRELFHPYVSPIDKLRVVAQEAWPGGANLENLHGKTMNTGLPRVFHPKAEALPHQDMAVWDVPDARGVWTMETQIAANVYLETGIGGELELWDFGFRTQEEYRQYSLADTYGLDRTKIPESAVLLRPRQGELILFDAQRVHAVRSVREGVRVTVSTFLGYRGPSQPLTFFS